MKQSDVPQDSGTSTYGGQRKIVYAVADDGSYEAVHSAGWNVESEATRVALRELAEQCDNAWQETQRGLMSPLYYYMALRRMDVLILAQATGFFQWQVRRHFRPKVFDKLGARALTRYCEALDIDKHQLRRLPDEPLHEPAS